MIDPVGVVRTLSSWQRCPCAATSQLIHYQIYSQLIFLSVCPSISPALTLRSILDQISCQHMSRQKLYLASVIVIADFGMPFPTVVWLKESIVSSNPCTKFHIII